MAKQNNSLVSKIMSRHDKNKKDLFWALSGKTWQNKNLFNFNQQKWRNKTIVSFQNHVETRQLCKKNVND